MEIGAQKAELVVATAVGVLDLPKPSTPPEGTPARKMRHRLNLAALGALTLELALPLPFRALANPPPPRWRDLQTDRPHQLSPAEPYREKLTLYARGDPGVVSALRA